MGMDFGITVMGMQVDVLMGMLMGVNQISMTVFVCVGVFVFMRMLQADCIFYHDRRTCYHDCHCNIKLHCRSFPQYYHAERNAQKRGNGIIGTCFCRS